MPFELRPYQKRMVEETRQKILNGAKGVLIQSPPGSGKSVVIAEITRLATDKGGHVLFLAHRRELLDNIRETYKKNGVNMDKVTISTPVRTLNNIESLQTPTLIITDESHHSKSKTYQTIYDYFDNIPRLGFTATPWRMNGEGFIDIYSEIVKGPTIQWLIDNHCLAPFKWYSQPLINRDDVDFKSIKKADESTAKQFSEAEIQGDLIKHYRKYADGRQAILYAPTIEMSKEFVKTFNDAGIHAVHADAKTPTLVRDGIMKDFKDGKIQILSNVDLISEGFNVPDCSCVIMCRPTKSIVLHLQQSMRCMRYQPNKTAIVLDHVGNGINLGIPIDPVFEEWTIKGRKKRSKQSEDSDLKTLQCNVCGQLFLREHIVDDKCPYCGTLLEQERERKQKEIDREIELRELERTKKLASKPMLPSNSIAENLEIAKAKGGRPIYKFFGGLTIAKGKKFTNDELVEIAERLNVKPASVYQAYQWALSKRNQKKTNGLTIRY